jgi:uncharacterized membrane protein YfcA
MPGAMLMVGLMLPWLNQVQESRAVAPGLAGLRQAVDWPVTRLTLVGRLFGTFAGVWVVASLSTRWLTLGIGLVTLLGVLPGVVGSRLIEPSVGAILAEDVPVLVQTARLHRRSWFITTKPSVTRRWW